MKINSRDYDAFPFVLGVILILFVLAGLLYFVKRYLTFRCYAPIRSKLVNTSSFSTTMKGNNSESELNDVSKIDSMKVPPIYMSWLNLTCSYIDKGGTKIITLDSCHGSLKAGDLTAVMGPRYEYDSIRFFRLLHILGSWK